MIDNFEQVANLLSFNSEDDFYFLQILQRKKDNPEEYLGSNNSSRLIKAYYIKSKEELFKRKSEIIKLCEVFNARAGINLNKRSYYKTAFNTLKKIAELMHNKAFTKIYRAWNTACGVHNGGDRIWLLDIDSKDESFKIRHSLIKFIRQKEPKNKRKILAEIPSKNGFHLITRCFDLRGFKEEFPDIEIHKNNPVNLYIP